jgi:hypothetical protein
MLAVKVTAWLATLMGSMDPTFTESLAWMVETVRGVDVDGETVDAR